MPGTPYPVVPWVGIMAAGYAFGAVDRLDAGRRRRLAPGLGAGKRAARRAPPALGRWRPPRRGGSP